MSGMVANRLSRSTGYCWGTRSTSRAGSTFNRTSHVGGIETSQRAGVEHRLKPVRTNPIGARHATG
jgi:hypothetical protein